MDFFPWYVCEVHFPYLAPGAQYAIRKLPVLVRSSAPLILLCNWIMSDFNVRLEASYESNFKITEKCHTTSPIPCNHVFVFEAV